jgi:hypothetical protein
MHKKEKNMDYTDFSLIKAQTDAGDPVFYAMLD